jgi:hypothetical protein
MNATKAQIMAIEPLPVGEWLSSVKEILDKNGYSTCKLSNKLIVWKDLIPYRNGIIYADGAVINRLWLSEKRSALSAINRRIYFKEDRFTIDSRPEYLIVSGSKPQFPKPQQQLESLWNILDIIKIGWAKPKLFLVEVDKIDFDNEDTRKVYIGSVQSPVPLSTYSSLYNELGFDYVPKGMEIIVCTLGNATIKDRDLYISHLTKRIKERNMCCGIKVASLDNINKNIRIIKKENRLPKNNKCILFIMPSKVPPPDRETFELFDELEMMNIPFRRAYSDDDFLFSVADQLPSILLAAGGKPHRSPYYLNGQPIWTIGLDMGHSSQDNYTKLALTLVNPEGILVKAWVAKQKLDETIHSDKFNAMLKLCVKELNKCNTSPFIVFLRDGRFFENDDIALSKEILGRNLSLFEYRKRHNPQLFYMDKDEPTFTGKAYYGIIPNAETIFLSTLENTKGKYLPKIAKVTWKKGWNGLDLNPSQIVGLLIQSATAPGLGLHPRLLPACIYWADGISKTSETDLRFRGQPIKYI